MKTVMAVVVFVGVTVASQTAFAQWAVFDPTNFAESVRQTIQQVKMVKNQIRMVQGTVKQIEYMHRNVTSLDVGSLQGLEQAYYRLNSVYMQSRAIGWQYGAMVDRYERLYAPDEAKRPDPKTYHEKRVQWEKETDTSIKQAMQAHGVVDDFEQKIDIADRLVAMSDSAQGQLQAIQVTNRLLNLMLQQLMELSYLIATDSRARLTAMNEERSRAKSAEHQRGERNFFRKTERKKVESAPNKLPRVQ